jgi:molybdopterin-guanine dinucleotide biosynthesis protein A
MASALEAMSTPLLLTVPCDSPLLDPRLAERLRAALVEANAEIAVAHDGERLQPVFALLTRALAPSLRAYLEAGEAKIDRWYARHRTCEVDFSDTPEMFVNVNTPEERDALEARLAREP